MFNLSRESKNLDILMVFKTKCLFLSENNNQKFTMSLGKDKAIYRSYFEVSFVAKSLKQ